MATNKFTRRYVALGAAAAIAVASLSALVPSALSQSVPTVKIDGSSTVFPVTEAVAEDFQKSKNGAVRVTVAISGTGGGFKKFCNGDTDISNASRPIKESERNACKEKGIEYIELPVAYDALTVVVHKDNTWATDITPAELKQLWDKDSKVSKWSEIRPSWPNEPIKLFGPGADSGTFDYFTEAINGKSGQSRTDYTPSEDDNVLVQGVSRDKNALGYFGFAYYEENLSRLKAVKINGVAPSKAAVIDGTYTPLSRPIFIYINKKAAERTEVKDFVNFYLQNGARLVDQVKYVPLPANAYTAATERFSKGTVGTVFAGRSTIGVRLEELLRLEGTN